MSKSRAQKSHKNAEIANAILDLSYEMLISKKRKSPIPGLNVAYLNAENAEFYINKLFEVIAKHTPKGTENTQTDFINLKTNAGYSAIYYAVKMGNFAIFKKLIKKGAELNSKYDGLNLRDIVQQELAKNPNNEEYKKIDDTLSGKTEINNRKYNINYDENLLIKFKEQIKDQKKSSQSWIMGPLKQKGYKESNGFCFGVAHMGAQAFLLTQRDKNQNLEHLENFSKRLKHLSEAKTTFQDIEMSQHKRILLVNRAKILIYKDKPEGFKLPPKEEQIEIEKILYDSDYHLKLSIASINKDKSLSNEAKQIEIENITGRNSDYILNQKDKINLEIDPFLNGVEIYQQMEKHTDLSSEKLAYQSCISGMNLVPNLALEDKGGAVVVDQFSGKYNNKKELQALFEKMQEIATQAANKNYNEPIVFVLDANNHAISIGYDPQKKTWRNIDANHPETINTAFSSSGIARVVEYELSTVFHKKPLDPLTINILSTAANVNKMQKEIITPLHQSNEWKSKHGFWARNKKNIMYAVGGVLLGAAFIAASILTAGILPAAATLALAAAGPLIIAAGCAPAVISAGTPHDTHQLKEHLKTSVEKYKKKEEEQNQEKSPSFKQSTIAISKQMHIDIKNTQQEDKKIITPSTAITAPEEKKKNIPSPAIELTQINTHMEKETIRPRSR